MDCNAHACMLMYQSRAQYDQIIQQRLTNMHATDTSLLSQVPFIVDAVWAAGLALNATRGNDKSCTHVGIRAYTVCLMYA